jgi:bacillithiol biosynthesis deacetylase BshB1
MEAAEVLVFGAHPDDIEIGCGGTVRKLVELGHRVALIDLCRGELGTRGDAKARASEAAEALRILGAGARENLDLPDGRIEPSPEAVSAAVDCVRRWRPRLVIAPHGDARHPDHRGASRLIYRASFLAGLPRLTTAHLPHRPRQLMYYGEADAMTPTFIVDVSAQFDSKMEAIRAYRTQFLSAASSDPDTRLTDPRMLCTLEMSMALLGTRIGVGYGEGFQIRGSLRVEDPVQLAFDSFA